MNANARKQKERDENRAAGRKRLDVAVTPAEKFILLKTLEALRQVPHIKIHPPGVAYMLGEVTVMKCPSCEVTRELTSFWRPGSRNKPAETTPMVCTACR